MSPTKSKPLGDMSDDELIAEWRHWDDRIKGATSWGAGIAAADGFRKEAAREMRRRSIEMPA